MPLCVDGYCGLGGWAEGFLAEGYQVVGFDIERHRYAVPADDIEALPRTRLMQYPGQLVLQDLLTVHGRQFRNADVLVFSPPCQEYSYMAMPWSRAKQIAEALRGKGEFPEGYTGSRTVDQLNALFNACFRIQREVSEAAGRYIPMVVENVKGAQPWVGPAKAHFGSFYLWGDVAMVGNRVVCGVPKFGRDVKAGKARGENVPMNFRTDVGNGVRFTSRDCGQQEKGFAKEWRDSPNGMPMMSSKSPARKAASAMIAKIPFALAQYVARSFLPDRRAECRPS